MTAQPTDELFEPGGDRARYVRRMFGEIAGRYDLMNTLMTGGRDGAWRRITAGALVRPGDRVIDAGCGTGDLAFACADAGAGAVLGVDFATPMLAHARRKARNRDADHISFALADATRLPLPARSGRRLVLRVRRAQHPRPRRRVGRGLRVLRPGGRIGALEIPRLEGGLLGPLIRLHFGQLVPLVGRLISATRTRTATCRSRRTTSSRLGSSHGRSVAQASRSRTCD